MAISNKPVIIILDDHPMIRTGAKYILKENFDCTVLEADDEDSLFRLAKQNKPDMVLLDINIPGGNSLYSMTNLLSHQPEICFLVFSMYKESVYAPLYLQNGARGYVQKNASSGELVKAVTCVLSGGIYIPRDIQDLVLKHNNPGSEHSPYDVLAKKEIEILSALASGSSLITISGLMNLSPSTIGTYKSRILQKLGVSNIIELRELIKLYPISQ